MIVCHCKVVSDSAVAHAVDCGARTLSEVCRRTGAGQECGTCVFSVRQAVTDHLSREIAPRQETIRAAS